MVKIMVADDNVEFSSKICKFLTKDKNVEIISQTVDGLITLENYLKLQPDLLILDLDLPSKNGIEIINELSMNLRERKKCNIVVISGELGMIHTLFNTAKVYRIITKPVSLNKLHSIIQEFVTYKTKQHISEKQIKDLLITLSIQPYSKRWYMYLESNKYSY